MNMGKGNSSRQDVLDIFTERGVIAITEGMRIIDPAKDFCLKEGAPDCSVMIVGDGVCGMHSIDPSFLAQMPDLMIPITNVLFEVLIPRKEGDTCDVKSTRKAYITNIGDLTEDLGQLPLTIVDRMEELGMVLEIMTDGNFPILSASDLPTLKEREVPLFKAQETLDLILRLSDVMARDDHLADIGLETDWIRNIENHNSPLVGLLDHDHHGLGFAATLGCGATASHDIIYLMSLVDDVMGCLDGGGPHVCIGQIGSFRNSGCSFPAHFFSSMQEFHTPIWETISIEEKPAFFMHIPTGVMIPVDMSTKLRMMPILQTKTAEEVMQKKKEKKEKAKELATGDDDEDG